MFVLFLNPVTANAESHIPVALSDNAQVLEKLLVDESCEPYSDGNYHRRYKEGLLHNFNPPTINGINFFGVNEGIVECISEEDLRAQHHAQMSEWWGYFSGVARL